MELDEEKKEVGGVRFGRFVDGVRWNSLFVYLFIYLYPALSLTSSVQQYNNKA